MKKMKKAMALGLTIAMATSSAQLTGLGIMKAEAATNISRVSVHDPSIFEEDGKYYVFGSHIATASSDDLVNWTQVSRDYQDVNGNVIYGNLRENLAESFKWAGYDDGDCAGGNYAVWAPDVIYNPDYVWEDGSKGAYMLYYSASSTWRRSCIGYMVSKNYDGGYQYGGTVVYSGFTNTGSVNYDGNSKRDTTYTNDYLPFNDLIADGVIDGDVSTWKCFNKDGSWNNNYAPNAIDPTLFYDASGEHLYMVYGSWSGGLFILELDKTTGEAIYPGTDGVEETSGNFVDRYFGVHIAGGNHQSGEGPYIEYDNNTGYYYMYETYGGLTTTGGYNMRLFRSKNVFGPYVDPAGNEAGESGVNCYKYGVKLIGNYQFYGQPGYRAAGHNSAMITDDGKYYLFYHQRFLDSSRGEGHEVRVRQQFLNEDDWLVTAVYENRNEQIQKYTKDDVVGSYEFVNHGNAEKDGSMISTESVTLNEDGTISGDKTGSWTMADAADYTYVTLNIGDATYKGVFFEQTNDNDEKTMTFTAIGNNNLAVWGSKFEESEDLVVGKVIDQLAGMLPDTTRENISLPKTLSGATITWNSDTPSILSNEGVVSVPSVDTKVKLTATITCGAESRTAEYEIMVYDDPHIIAGYDFENVDGTSVSATGASVVGGNATLIGTASVINDETRGEVLKVENSEGNKQVNYLSLPNDLFKDIDKSGYTVSMWVNIDASTWEHSALFEADMVSGGAVTGNYPMTRIGANLIGRINANDYSDAVPGIAYGELTDKWQLVTYTVDTKGIKVYLNGNQIVYDKKDISNCFSGKNAAIQNANHIMVGAGDIWSDEDCRNALFDDVRIYDTALTASEISSLYDATYMDNKEDEPKEPEHKVKPIAEEEPDAEGMTKLYIRLEDDEFYEEANVYAVDTDGNPVGFGEEPGKAMAHIGNGWYSVNVPNELLASEDEEDLKEEIKEESKEENKEDSEDAEKEILDAESEETKSEEIPTEETILDKVEEVLEELVDEIKSAFSPMEVKAAESNIFADGVILSVNNGKDYSIAGANSLFTMIRPSAEELMQEESEEPANPEPTPVPQPASGNQSARPVPSNQSSSSSSNSSSTSVSAQPAANNTVTTVAEAQVPLAGDTKIASNKTNKVTKNKTTKSTNTTEEKLSEEANAEEETEENDIAENKEEISVASSETEESVAEETIEDEEVAKAALDEEINSNGFGILPIVIIILIVFGGAITAYLLRKNK
jgi:beta-xylosidase